jgi:hypothetical protein
VNPFNRSLLSIGIAALLVSPASFGFQSPLSDESVREAYFLGQRHDGSVPRLLDKYTRRLPSPKTGPYISSVAFFTPFAQFAQFSDAYIGNYSAQQARLDHQGHQEFVKIIVHIQLTDSYGRFMNNPAQRISGSSPPLVPRPYDFWKDFHVLVSSENQPLAPSSFRGTPDSMCGRRGPCILTGATLELDFPAESFTSDSATVQVIPPEGDPASVEFDLTRLR